MEMGMAFCYFRKHNAAIVMTSSYTEIGYLSTILCGGNTIATSYKLKWVLYCLATSYRQEKDKLRKIGACTLAS